MLTSTTSSSPGGARAPQRLAACAMRAALLATATALTVTLGCSTPSATSASDGSHPPSQAQAPATTSATALPSPATAAPPAQTPTGVASTADPAAAAAPTGEATAPPPAVQAPAEAPLPDVKVTNIGMHIGGGPHDAVTKAPIKLSVEPHFDDLRRCWTHVDDPKKGGDFGVDLRIEREGGKAQVTKPRTALKGEGFSACVVGVFEKIDFRKPRGGTTVVSYSIRFAP